MLWWKSQRKEPHLDRRGCWTSQLDLPGAASLGGSPRREAQEYCMSSSAAPRSTRAPLPGDARAAVITYNTLRAHGGFFPKGHLPRRPSLQTHPQNLFSFLWLCLVAAALDISRKSNEFWLSSNSVNFHINVPWSTAAFMYASKKPKATLCFYELSGRRVFKMYAVPERMYRG